VSEQQETFQFDGFAVIEFMGHRKRAGKVKTAEIGGTAVFQVETKTPDGQTLTEVYNASSLYCLTPCTEAVASIAARSINPSPVSTWDLPERAREALRRMDAEDRAKAAAIDAGDPEEQHDEVNREEEARGYADFMAGKYDEPGF
jgi:hypothetical protein